MKKFRYQNFILFFLILFLIGCSSTEKIEKFKNKIPKWYLAEKQSTFSYFGNALGESVQLELALRKAEILAVSNVLFKIRSEAEGLRISYLRERYSKNNKKKITSSVNEYEEKLKLAIKNYEIKNYKVSKKKIYRSKNTYKAFVQIQVSKSNIFIDLDSID